MIRCGACGAKNRLPSEKIDTAARCGKCRVLLETEGLLSREPVIVTDRDFDSKVLKSPLPVLFLCWATWCPSCRIVIPLVDQLADEWSGRARIGKLNVDANPVVANKFQILSVPTLFIFDNGKLKETITGALPKHELVQKMVPYI
jgi:thioredoxin